jgi:cell division protein FtsQ
MERSLTARLGRPRFAPAPRQRGEPRKRSAVEILWRPFDAAAVVTRSAFQAILRHRRLRIALLAALIALPLLAGGWLLLRKSSFVTVEHVRVSGVHGPDATAIEAALAGVAQHMSTLDLHPAALRAAVAEFPVVRSVRAIPSFPHGLHIDVVEQLPVAALTVGGERTAVAADGVVLGPALLSGSLPALGGSANVTPTGRRVQDATLRGALTVLGDAPAPLARAVKRVYMGPKGLTLEMRNGLLAYFGDASLPHAKWLSLARVLADRSSAGAAYVDERLPERPAAGFAGGVVPEAGAAGVEPGSVSDPSTAAELAAGLTAAVGGGSSSAPSTTASPAASEAATGSTSTEAPAGTGAEAASGAATETAPGATAEAPSSTPTSGG